MILARVVRRAFVRTVRPGPNLAAIRVALARAEALVLRLPIPPLERPAPPRVTTPCVLPALEEVSSPWDPDPEPGATVALLVQEFRPPPRDEALMLQEIQGCKQLLIEIIRRAAYDWVLYRGHRRMVQRALADSAYRWLFLETENSVDWNERKREGKYITGFEAICESLDMDPNKIRRYVRLLTPKNVTSVGRPAEYSSRGAASRQSDGDVYSLPDGLVPLDDVDSGSDNGSGF